MTPADPDYEQRTRDSFARQPAMTTIGIELGEVGPGTVSLSRPYRADLTQQHGFQHAGIVATGLDSACGYAAFSLMPAEAGVLTIEFKVNLLAPARGPLLRCEAQVAKAGRTIVKRLCPHFAMTRPELFEIVRVTGLRSLSERKTL